MKHILKTFLVSLPVMLIAWIILAAPFALMKGLDWCSDPYYVSEDIAWTICDKYYHNGYRTASSYWIALEYSDGDITLQETVSVEKEAWSDYVIGDTVMYPAEIVSNWEHYVKGINPAMANKAASVMPICSNCGAECTTAFCGDCGTPMNQEDQS